MTAPISNLAGTRLPMNSFVVSAPSRLHFGLFALSDVRCAFGGVGVMVDQPGLVLSVSPAEQFSACGTLASRVEQFAERATEAFGWPSPPACRLEVLRAAPEHSGLGLGTQLGLATAAALDRFAGGSVRPVNELALAVGRCGRSSVGAYGFDQGGLIVDGGHEGNEPLGRLEMRCAPPAEWRFLLISASASTGLSGHAERAAFERLPAFPAGSTDRLRRLALERLAPAALAGEFGAFTEALGEYGRLSGACFAPIQGGAFASRAIAELVDTLTRLGAVGCGQSSWGPTVFAVARSEEAAEDLERRLRQERGYARIPVRIAKVCNHGARIESSPQLGAP